MKRLQMMFFCLVAICLTACVNSDGNNYFSRYNNSHSFLFQTSYFPQTYNGTANYGERSYRRTSTDKIHYKESCAASAAHKKTH